MVADYTFGQFVASLGVALIGAGVAAWWGSRLAAKNAREARADERVRLREERLREREEEAVMMLDESLLEVSSKLPRDATVGRVRDAYAEARLEFDRAWRRSVLVRDPELLDRVRVVGTTLTWPALGTVDDAHDPRLYEASVRAIGNARRAIAAFLKDDPWPEPTYPSPGDLKQMSPFKGGKANYTTIYEWLIEHVPTD